MKLLILAGGFGTRLQSAVPGIPKALAPINDVPFLRFQIKHWIEQGVRSFVFLLHHQASLIVDFLREEQKASLRGSDVNWLIEPMPMGTGGAVAHAVNELNLTDSFLVTNADTWLGGGIKQVMHAGAPGMAVIRVANAGRYGRVVLNTENNRIQCFAGKGSTDMAGWINTGLCCLPPALFRNWDRMPFSLETDVFPDLVAQGKLHAAPLETDFIDIGVPEDYFRFCSWIKTGRGGALCS
jgi:D-glycero-alpha-D-manno-heptose 1-phosphate guanylyltransferase